MDSIPNAADIAARYRARKLSSVETTSAVLKRHMMEFRAQQMPIKAIEAGRATP